MASFATFAPVIRADELTTVHLRDGRVVTGAVDGRTDDHRLWLTAQTTGLWLASGFEWSEIEQVTVGAATFTARRFQRRLATRPDEPLPTLAQPEIGALPASPLATSASQPVAVSAGPVRSLYIEARLANWDDDVPADGLLVTVWPLDALGRLTPVHGGLDLSLLAEVFPTTAGERSPLRPGFQELERASHRIAVEDFAAGPAVYRLSFDRVHPDYAFQIAHFAVLHARLGVPGQGVFEASDPFVRIRGFSPPRDRLQHATGQRYFSREHQSGRDFRSP